MAGLAALSKVVAALGGQGVAELAPLSAWPCSSIQCCKARRKNLDPTAALHHEEIEDKGDDGNGNVLCKTLLKGDFAIGCPAGNKMVKGDCPLCSWSWFGRRVGRRACALLSADKEAAGTATIGGE